LTQLSLLIVHTSPLTISNLLSSLKLLTYLCLDITDPIISSVIGQLSQLKTFICTSFHVVDSLDNSLLKLPQLEVLILQTIEMSESLCDSFKSLRELKVLEIYCRINPEECSLLETLSSLPRLKGSEIDNAGRYSIEAIM